MGVTEECVKPETDEDERRRREFLDWVHSPFPVAASEPFPVSQIGPDGKRKARYRKAAA